MDKEATADGRLRAASTPFEGGVLIRAPVYVMGGVHTHTSWGDFYDVSGMIKLGLARPILVRGRDLKVPNHPIVPFRPSMQ